MSSPISGSSFVFQDVYIQSVGTTAGIVEHQGPLGHYFDKHYPKPVSIAAIKIIVINIIGVASFSLKENNSL